MAIDDKAVNLRDLKVSHDDLDGKVTDLKSDLNSFYKIESTDNITGWEQGYIRALDGTGGSDPERCRTQAPVNIGDGLYRVTVADGYALSMYKYTTTYIASYVGRLFFDVTGEFTIELTTGYYKFVVTKTDGGSFAPSDVPSTVASYSYLAKTDTSLTESGFPADAKTTGDGIREAKENFFKIASFSPNIFDQSAMTDHAYISPNGLQTSSSYANFFASDYIDVNGETTLQSNIPLNSIILYNANGTVDTTNSYSNVSTPINTPFTIPSTAKRIRFSSRRTYLDGAMLNFGDELLPYSEYGNVSLNDDVIPTNIEPAKFNSAYTTETFLSEYKQALKKGVVLNYYATFSEFSSLLIGFTSSDSASGYIDYVEITATSFILHRKNQADITWEHGLTIKDYLSVRITFDFAMQFSAVVKTNGGEYTRSNYFLIAQSYYPFAVITATNTVGNKLSFTCEDFRKRIAMFGDSYFGNGTTRWPYYLTESQLSHICMNGYAGESSPSAIVDCESVVDLASPLYAVWCLGMNDGSDTDDTTPSTQWLTNVQRFISMCEENGIVPVLATIPSVPTINNRAKSAWVRNSEYRYIDFAAAVNTGTSGAWFDGMLSSDGVHPDVNGAKALCARLLTDFPEIEIE